MEDMEDFFDEEDEFEKILRESQFRDAVETMELDDADYQVGIIRDFGLRVWFSASKFPTVKDAISILEWSRHILEKHERFEDCCLLRDSSKWLKVSMQRNGEIVKAPQKAKKRSEQRR